MRSRLVVFVLAFTLASAGCFGGADEKDKKKVEPTPIVTPTNETNFTVQADPVLIEPPPFSAEVGAEIDVIWSVDFGPNGPPRANETGVLWGNASVAKPLGPESYAGAAGVQRDVDVPANLTTNVSADAPGPLYLRAYATHGTVTYFSAEVSVNVTEIVPTVITIGGQLTGPLAAYSPAQATVAAGGWVQWDNQDPFDHTATAQSGAPAPFDVQAEANALSEMIRLRTPGTYTYACTIHPTMTSATLVVS